MTQRIRIEGIDFERVCSAQINTIEVCGLKVPTEKSCDSMLNILPNVESRLEFIIASNGWVNNNGATYNPINIYSIPESSIFEKLNLEEKNIKNGVEDIKLLIRLIEIDKILAEITGFDFAFLRRAKALMDWHQTLRGGYTVINQQKLRKALNSISKVLKNPPYPLSFESIPVKDYSHLLRVSKQETPDEYYIRDEYSRAYDYVYRFFKTVNDLAIIDSTIRKLNIEEINIMKKIVTNAESDPMYLLYRFCCPFCGKHELIEKGKKPKSCESLECTKAYSAATTRKSSNQPHALNKKSKKPDSRWVKIDNIPRWCSECEPPKRRLVDAKQICQPCRDKQKT
jgi:hypothetical protein